MAMFEIHTVDEQIKSLPIVDTASGSVATFDTDMTENLVEVKCQIVAKQSGSGTPSPENERPITTYTEMNVSHTGKNLFDKSLLLDQVAWNVITLQLKPNTTYTMSSNLPDTATSELPCYFFPTSGSPSPSTMVYSGHAMTLTTLSDGIVTIQERRITGTDSFQNYNWQIELGSRETTYEPYNGTTSNIPFGQTVAGGVINVTTGKLKVTDGVYNVTGMEDWTVVGSGTNLRAFISGVIPNKKASAKGICNIFKFGSANYPGEFDMEITYLRFNINGIATTKEEFNAWIANNPVTVVYELATPQEIQLDSVQIQALLNENNVWCDTGDTEVKYLLTLGRVS